jgi:hypothetical protein
LCRESSYWRGSKALIPPEEKTRASEEATHGAASMGRQEYKGYEIKCNNYDSIRETVREFGTSQAVERAWVKAEQQP